MKVISERIPRSRSLSEQGPAAPFALSLQTPHISHSNNQQFLYPGLNPSPSVAEPAFSTEGPDAWGLNTLTLGQISSGPVPQTFGGSMPRGQGFPDASSNSIGDLFESHPDDQVSAAFSIQDQSLSSLSFDASQDITALWSNVPSDFK